MADATGLTNEQKVLVQKSWLEIKDTWKVNGIEFFYRLFTEHPNITAYFKSFNDLDFKNKEDQEKLRKSTKLRAHAINFKAGLTTFVDQLDDVATLVCLVEKLTDNHIARNIVKPELFKEALDAFLEFAVEKYLNKNDDKQTIEAWGIIANTLVKIIGGRMKEQNDHIQANGK